MSLHLEINGCCPMGCGRTLVAYADGNIWCSRSECSRPDAVAQILDDGESEHIVTFGDVTFTVRHPLRERLDNDLMECELHEYIAGLDGPPVDELGTYRAMPDGDTWFWERVSS